MFVYNHQSFAEASSCLVHAYGRVWCWRSKRSFENHDMETDMNFKTMQTTTVAAQASVSRRDMSVVTAVRNVSG
jgi:hypothetical protein